MNPGRLVSLLFCSCSNSTVLQSKQRSFYTFSTDLVSTIGAMDLDLNTSKAYTTFTCFPKLPTELQIKIFHYMADKPRTVKLYFKGEGIPNYNPNFRVFALGPNRCRFFLFANCRAPKYSENIQNGKISSSPYSQ